MSDGSINRELLVEHISPIPAANGVSILIANDILSVANFGQGVTGRIPAYVLSNGQTFLNVDQWRNDIIYIRRYTRFFL